MTRIRLPAITDRQKRIAAAIWFVLVWTTYAATRLDPALASNPAGQAAESGPQVDRGACFVSAAPSLQPSP
jgi:hypothetical protein